MLYYYTPDEIYRLITKSGETKANYPLTRLLFKGILGGMFIAIAACSTSVAMHAITNVSIARLIAGVTFPVGLMLILLTGSELLTGDAFLFLNRVDHKITVAQFFRVIIGVFFSNFVGALLVAVLVVYSGQLGFSQGGLALFAMQTATAKVTMPLSQVFVSAVLCNLLVCACVIGGVSAKDVTGKLWGMFFPVMAFAITGVEHCVANMYFISVGLIAKYSAAYSALAATIDGIEALTVQSMLFANIIPVTIGNMLGGLLFSVILFYAMRPTTDQVKT